MLCHDLSAYSSSVVRQLAIIRSESLSALCTICRRTCNRFAATSVTSSGTMAASSSASSPAASFSSSAKVMTSLPSFPSLRRTTNQQQRGGSGNSTNANTAQSPKAPAHLLLLHRLSQLIETNQQQQISGIDPSKNDVRKEYANEAITNIERLIDMQLASVGMTADATASADSKTSTHQLSSTSHHPSLSLPPSPFTLTSQHYTLIIHLLRSLPHALLPLGTIDLVWSHMSSQSVAPPKWSQLTSHTFIPFTPNIRQINQMIALYSHVKRPNDRVWRIWPYLREKNIEPTMITVNAIHSAMLKAFMQRHEHQAEGENMKPKSPINAVGRELFELICRDWEAWRSTGTWSTRVDSSRQTTIDGPQSTLHPSHTATTLSSLHPLLVSLAPSIPDLADRLCSPHGDHGFYWNLLQYNCLIGEPLRALEIVLLMTDTNNHAVMTLPVAATLSLNLPDQASSFSSPSTASSSSSSSLSDSSHSHSHPRLAQFRVCLQSISRHLRRIDVSSGWRMRSSLLTCDQLLAVLQAMVTHFAVPQTHGLWRDTEKIRIEIEKMRERWRK